MKTLEEMMKDFEKMCYAQFCETCKYNEFSTKRVCRAAYIYDQLVETRPGKEDSASEKPATADKMKAVQLPAWCKVGAWVMTEDGKILKIDCITGDLVSVRSPKGLAYCTSTPDLTFKPIRFRPYTLEEAQKLIGKKMHYTAGNGLPVIALIHTVSRKFPADPQARINGADFQFYADRNAKIEGMTLGVPEIDTEAMKGDEETVPCDTCKHSRWFGEYGMQVCEKRGTSCPRGACNDHEKKGGEK